ncbi:S15/NS1 RNA-binding domain-containing protein [Pisolithus marmoratus]|nr:S15/NS1 RNA-binding domain-containing protein [Pisolithus marmoratus]
MYRILARQATQRSVASTARVQLHTSAVRLAQRKKVKESKSAIREERKRNKDAARLYAVLGIPRGGQDKWPQCDLAKAAIIQDQLHSDDAHEALEFSEGAVHIPPTLNYGISGHSRKMLFEVLPVLSAERGRVHFNADTVQETEEAMGHEVAKANMFAKLVSLRNANAKGIAYENRRRCIDLFSAPETPNDTGRPEVQAAILTLKIRNLWEHLLKFRMDIDNRRALRRMVHQRAKVLKYLKQKDLDCYEAVLPRLGLEPGSVEGELLV